MPAPQGWYSKAFLAPSHHTLLFLLVAPLKHLLVLFGGWLWPHPNLEVLVGEGIRL